MVVGNPLIRSPEHIPQIFEASAFGHAASAQDFFRPIQTLSYILDYQLFGLEAAAFHRMSWLYFCIVCLLFFCFLRLLSAIMPESIHSFQNETRVTNGDENSVQICDKHDFESLRSKFHSGMGLPLSKPVCWMITALFAVHPLNIEVVSYVSGRGDVLFLLFALMALCSTMLAAKGHTWAIPMVWLSTLFALFSKENAVALPFIITALWLILPQAQRHWRYWMAIIPPLLGNLYYIGYRLMALGDPNSVPLSTIAFASPFERLLTVPYILWTYCRLVFLPYPLHMEYLHVVTEVLNPYLWLGLPIIGLVLIQLWRYFGPALQAKRIYLFFLLWIAMGLGPVLHITPLTATVREHWFSFPLMAALSLLVIGLWQRGNGVTAWCKYSIFGIVLLTLTCLTYTRNLDWADPMRLYTHDVALEPRSFLLHNNIGVLHYRNQSFSEAKQSFQKAVLVTPGENGYGTALNNLGVIAEHERQISLALDYYRRSIIASRYELAYTNALRLLLMDKQWETALPLAQEALIQYPYHKELLQYGAIAYFQTGQAQEGNGLLKRLKQLYPE